MYRDMDRLVGDAMAHVDRDTAFFVLSDHGFCAFRRGVNLNSWLRQNGYLALKDDRPKAENISMESTGRAPAPTPSASAASISICAAAKRRASSKTPPS